MTFGLVSNSYVGLIDRLHSSNYGGSRRCSRVRAARNGGGGNLRTGGRLLEVNSGTTCKSHFEYDYALFELVLMNIDEQSHVASTQSQVRLIDVGKR